MFSKVSELFWDALGSAGSSKESVKVYTEHDNNQFSPLVVIGGIHFYPEGFGIIIVFLTLYTVYIRRNYKAVKPKPFYESE